MNTKINIRQKKEILNLGKVKGRNVHILALALICSFFTSSMLMQVHFNIRRAEKEKIEMVEVTDLQKKEIRLRKVLKGYPIEKMSSFIAQKDERVAAYLVAIAKKESNWGKRRPVFKGEDCYNYWGFREVREKMGSGGHTCFESPQDAIDTVASRIEELVVKYNVKSAKDIIIWKCGYSCEAHNPQSVAKWIRDVDFYAKKIIM